MDHFDRNIFQELISDIRFIRWAKGKKNENAGEWKDWKSVHPKKAKEFDEAVKVVKSFNFSSPAISDQEIQYLWDKTSGQFPLQKQIPKVRKLTNLLTRVAAILLIPLLVYTAWIYFSKQQVESSLNQMVENTLGKKITVVAPIGARTAVDLPDGSKVWLNAGSQLSYPPVFDGSERKVHLEGEAFFDIQKRENPFIVQNLGPAVKVYGTSFNVNSYSDEELVTVALLEGKVSLQLNGQEKFLTPGQISYYNKELNSYTVKNEDTERFGWWREGKYVFRDTPLNAILRVLQRQYHVEIGLTKPELGNFKYNATFQNESLEQILELLELSAPINYNYVKRSLQGDGSFTKGKVIISEDKKRNVKHEKQ